MNEFRPVQKYIEKIDSWISVVIISVLAAIGINLLVSGITVLTNGQYARHMVICGSVLIIIPTFVLLFWPISKQKRDASIRGFFIYNKKDRSMYLIPEYYISLVMYNHINSALQCEKEISRIWKQNDCFAESKKSKENGYHIDLVRTELGDIFFELLEYCVLKELSNHLTCYFQEYSDKEIMTLHRNDIPGFLLENRFLNWLSAEKYDMEKEREIMFSDLSEEEKIKECMKLWPKGSFSYSHFEMKIPQGSVIRKEGNTIILDHRVFSLSIEPYFSGSNASIPHNYIKYYLGWGFRTNGTPGGADKILDQMPKLVHES